MFRIQIHSFVRLPENNASWFTELIHAAQVSSVENVACTS